MQRPRKLSTKQLRDLTQKWQRKLRASGFVSIENPGMDWTFSAGHSVRFVQGSTDDTGGTVADTSQALLWREIGQLAHALPGNFPGRRFLVLWADSGNELEAARLAGIGRKRGRTLVAEFCRVHGLDRAGLYSAAYQAPRPEVAEPAPVRRFTRREIAQLNRSIQNGNRSHSTVRGPRPCVCGLNDAKHTGRPKRANDGAAPCRC